ncbi:MAG: histone deacetylase family protein [Candidatus Njordarchaeia archaeon]
MVEALVFSRGFERVDFGADHPFSAERFRRVFKFFSSRFPDLTVLEPHPVGADDLLLVHSREYVDSVRVLSERGSGFLSLDTPVFRGMFEWGLLYCGGSVLAADFASRGSSAFNPCGGLHHAHRSWGGGFCVFNDVALAAVSLFRRGLRVAVVDWDAHAGDGTMEILYEVPILKISIHEDPHYLYPGDGFVEEVGRGDGYGFTINVPLEPFSGDREFIFAFEEIVVPALKKFDPDVVVLQSGADGYHRDPLTHLNYTVEGYRIAAELLHRLGKPVAMLGGGGYDLDALPVIWGTVYATLIDAFDIVEGDYNRLAREKVSVDEKVFKVVEATVNKIREWHPFFRDVEK